MRLGARLHARAGSAVTEADVARALCRADPELVIVGISAARLWSVPLPRELGTWAPGMPVHVASMRGPRTTRAVAGITRHALTLGPEETITSGSLRVLSAPRMFVELGSILGLDALVAAGDALVRRPRPRLEGRSLPWTTIEALRDAAALHHGRGARRAREAAALVRLSADSAPETFLRLATVRGGLPEPAANSRISADGADLGEPDLSWREHRVCLEHEGHHHLTPARLARDIARSERRHRWGWVEVRTTSADLRDGCARGVSRVRAALVRQGWRPGG